MIDAVFFDKLVSTYSLVSCPFVLSSVLQEAIARQVRNKDRPFGGIQVIFLYSCILPLVERCS